MRGDGREGVGTQHPLSLAACSSGSHHWWGGFSRRRTSRGGGGRQQSPAAPPQEPECLGRGSPEELPGEASCLPSLGSGQPLAPGTAVAPRPSTCLVQGLLLRWGGCLEGHRPDPTAYVPLQGLQPSSSASSTEGRDSGSVSSPETLSLVLPLAEPPEPVTRDRQEMERLLVPSPWGLSCLSPRWFS